MRIGVDVDEVLCVTNEYFVDYFNKKHNTSYKREDILDYDYTSFVSHDSDFVISELKCFIEDNLDKFDIIGGARDTLEKLKGLGHEIVILTSRRVEIRERTIRWLKDRFGDDFFDEFLIYNRSLSRKRCKSEISVENRIGVLIEDAPHYAARTASCGIPVLLFDCPWNRMVEESELLVRVRDWDEIDEKIRLFL
jgi:uncharacterized HAD superfamily protein